jgi:Ni/Fe-hydrogenase 1 B-type cytochrome subunit
MATVMQGKHSPDNQAAIYVFEAPVRIWHWAHALSILVLAGTGYLIANPLPSIGGEASEHFLMGNLRLIHFVAGYVFGIGFVVRIYWAIVGNKYSRELFFPPLFSASWWRQLWYEVRFYLFLTRKMEKTPGHNPLAQTAMWLFNVLLGIFMILTGFALYSEGLGLGSWADDLFGWVIPFLGGPQSTRMWHLLGMWLLLVFAMIHTYMAIRADIIGRQSSTSTIIGGWRTYKDDLP